MNENELSFFDPTERELYDATSLPPGYLLKTLFVKFRRKTYGKLFDRKARLVWTVSAVSDAVGPKDNVRNYLERRTIRTILKDIAEKFPVQSACEIGCGYGRLIMVLKELAPKVVGFEREMDLVNIAERLLPGIEFYNVKSLDTISKVHSGTFDLVMVNAVLQHLTDEFCQKVLDEAKRLVPKGHVMLIEKTEIIAVTDNVTDGNHFISQSRSIDTYAKYMHPYNLVSTKPMIAEPTYFNPTPATIMLFKST